MWTKILPDIASIHMKETKKKFKLNGEKKKTNEIADTLFTASFSAQ